MEFLGSIIIGYLVLSIDSGLRLTKSVPMRIIPLFVNKRISPQIFCIRNISLDTVPVTQKRQIGGQFFGN